MPTKLPISKLQAILLSGFAVGIALTVGLVVIWMITFLARLVVKYC